MTQRHFILIDRQPVEAAPMDWAKWFEAADRSVGFDRFGPVLAVSTVFLGIDHRHGGDGPPLIFETAVFRGKAIDVVDRYATWAEADKGHRVICGRYGRGTRAKPRSPAAGPETRPAGGAGRSGRVSR